MCFSEPVSFIAGGLLITGGAYAAWKAWNINKRYVPVAMMPVFAGIQQVMEGHVWMGLNHSDPNMVWWGAIGFILFSWLMWPTWIPFSIYYLEPPDSKRKKPLLVFALAGFSLGLILFIPHLINPEWVDVAINKHSIAYEGTMFLDYFMPRELTYGIYLFLIITPPLLSTYLHMRLFGVTLIAVVTIVFLFLSYAYISFFCLLAGVATLHLIYIIIHNKCCRECPEIFG
ncbi:MAG: hypothetical protein COA84_05185 [Robiginitomaculum sp.]|nr:MAG: hypothetical protein COA84_05185 [Robiginitomaculum sp.]